MTFLPAQSPRVLYDSRGLSYGPDLPRVIVTASRDHPRPEAVRKALDETLAELGPFLLVHGNCPTGGDAYADAWSLDHQNDGVRVWRENAEWTRDCDTGCHHAPRTRDGENFCPAAGPIRNRKMVSDGAARCLGFPFGKSTGTRGCMKLADDAGIPVLEYPITYGEAR